MTLKRVRASAPAYTMDGALAECKLAGLDPATLPQDYDAEQVTMCTRGKFIHDQFGLGEEESATLKLSENPISVLSRRRDNVDMLRAQGVLGVSYPQPGQRDKTRRWDILTVRPETLTANTEIGNRERLIYVGPEVPASRSDFLVAATSRVEANVQLLKGKWSLNIREGGDLLAKDPADVEAAAVTVGKSRSPVSVETVRSKLNK